MCVTDHETKDIELRTKIHSYNVMSRSGLHLPTYIRMYVCMYNF